MSRFLLAPPPACPRCSSTIAMAGRTAIIRTATPPSSLSQRVMSASTAATAGATDGLGSPWGFPACPVAPRHHPPRWKAGLHGVVSAAPRRASRATHPPRPPGQALPASSPPPSARSKGTRLMGLVARVTPAAPEEQESAERLTTTRASSKAQPASGRQSRRQVRPGSSTCRPWAMEKSSSALRSRLQASASPVGLLIPNAPCMNRMRTSRARSPRPHPLPLPLCGRLRAACARPHA